VFIQSANATLYEFTSHTFTNCAATGSAGPLQASCRSAYSTTWDENNSYFVVTSGIQYWTVPATGTYTINAYGSRCGNTSFVGSVQAGGAGARVLTTLDLTKGHVIKILVGQIGGSFAYTAGGGGGTYIYNNTTATPLAVAGGGGGGGSSGGTGFSGVTTSNGGTGHPGYAAGINGNGSATNANSGWGMSGAGIFGNGNGSGPGTWQSGANALSFLNGGTGSGQSGSDPNSACNGAPGGFGGGGGGACNGGGGGGGYSGGGPGGGGGGSYAAGINTTISANANSSAGYVTITLISSPDTTPPTFTSSTSFSAAENIATSANAATIKVSESATVTISSGVDAGLFNIVTSDTVTAFIRFKASPNFEVPSDNGGNNVYDLVLTATDLASNAGTQTITITVTDVVDTSSFNSFALSGSASFRTVVTITANVTVASRVTFRARGVIIAGCKNKLTTGSSPNIVATCSWRPSTRGAVVLTATATPTGAGISSATATPISVMVGNRSGGRS